MQEVRSQIPERFEIREELYRSEQNVRLRAFDTKLQQEVVLEYSGIGARPFERRTVLRQARMRAKVQHDKIPALKEIIETPEAIVHVLQPSPGEPLEAMLRNVMHLAPEDVLELGIELCGALHALHAEGVVHRAIDTTNILVNGPGELSVLTGFAFAKPIDGMGQSSLQYAPTAENTPIAKALPHHPAPEQVAGQAADARSDVYGLGCVLYRCMTGNEAFVDHTAPWREPAHPNPAGSPLAPRLAEIIMKCLRHSPMARYQTMLDLREDLLKLKEKGVSGTDRGARRPAWLAAAAVAVLALGGWIAVKAWRDTGASDAGRTVDPAEKPALRSKSSRFSDTYARSYALLIGTNYEGARYEPKLKNAENDIEEIRQCLLELGWRDEDVFVLAGSSATYSAIKARINHLIDETQPDDQLFFYFAGHGVIDLQSNIGGAGSLIPHNGGPRGRRIGENWLDFAELRRVYRCSAKHILVALDCCYSGEAFGAMRGDYSPDLRPYSSRDLQDLCHYMITSCSKNQLAMDGVGEHSPFATGFIQAIRKARPGDPVSMIDVIYTIQQIYRQKTGDLQRFRPDQLKGEGVFHFVNEKR